MTRLIWADRPYEIGLDRGVLYPKNAPAEVWNGLISVDESPDTSNYVVRHIDGIRVQSGRGSESFAASVIAFSCPEIVSQVLRSGQRPIFDFSYRVQTESGHQIHLVYNALLIPSSLSYEQQTPSEPSWALFTIPMHIPGARLSAHLVVNTSTAYPEVTTLVEDLLYGTDSDMARMPTPTELDALFEANSILRVIDNGDGSFTITGPDSAIQMLDATTFQVSWPSAVYIDSNTYTIKSL